MAGSETTTIWLQIPYNAKYVFTVRKSVKCLAESLGFSTVECQDIELAVAEAVSNAIVHGRPVDSSPGVTVRCCARPGCLTIEVEDDGRGECPPESEELPPDWQEHGRGAVIMRELMDEVTFHCTEAGLLLTMSKRSRQFQEIHLCASESGRKATTGSL